MPDVPEIRFERGEDFTSLYANNVQFESSVWDLKMIFGQLDQGKGVIEQHTSMTLSWLHAKVAAYYLLINVLLQQSRTGAISIPSVVTPSRPDRNDPTIENEEGRRVVDYLAWVHDQFFGPNPFTPAPQQATPPIGSEPKTSETSH